MHGLELVALQLLAVILTLLHCCDSSHRVLLTSAVTAKCQQSGCSAAIQQDLAIDPLVQLLPLLLLGPEGACRSSR